jgi:hypothetical protein
MSSWAIDWPRRAPRGERGLVGLDCRVWVEVAASLRQLVQAAAGASSGARGRGEHRLRCLVAASAERRAIDRPGRTGHRRRRSSGQRSLLRRVDAGAVMVDGDPAPSAAVGQQGRWCARDEARVAQMSGAGSSSDRSRLTGSGAAPVCRAGSAAVRRSRRSLCSKSQGAPGGGAGRPSDQSGGGIDAHPDGQGVDEPGRPSVRPCELWGRRSRHSRCTSSRPVVWASAIPAHCAGGDRYTPEKRRGRHPARGGERRASWLAPHPPSDVRTGAAVRRMRPARRPRRITVGVVGLGQSAKSRNGRVPTAAARGSAHVVEHPAHRPPSSRRWWCVQAAWRRRRGR